MSPSWIVHHGDCIDVMRSMPEASVDSIVTDPPYGLGFMGKEWDHGVPGVAFWTDALRVAKPGAHLLAFGGTRTFHRLAVAIEDAGWEIRDCLSWLYGQGFPKSLDVAKAIDKAAGAVREVVGSKSAGSSSLERVRRVEQGYRAKLTEIDPSQIPVTAPATEEAKRWCGWGTALKPAWEPVIVARKPLDGTVAQNVQRHGTGAMNVDACRIRVDPAQPKAAFPVGDYGKRGTYGADGMRTADTDASGRWPANVVLDAEAAVLLDGQAGVLQSGTPAGLRGERDSVAYGADKGGSEVTGFGDCGGASRFFYVAKADRAERGKLNEHPTVKPVDVMRWLVRLVTRQGGLVLDPFCGSGSTGIAALREFNRFIGIEREAKYVEIARRRIAAEAAQGKLEFT